MIKHKTIFEVLLTLILFANVVVVIYVDMFLYSVFVESILQYLIVLNVFIVELSSPLHF